MILRPETPTSGAGFVSCSVVVDVVDMRTGLSFVSVNREMIKFVKLYRMYIYVIITGKAARHQRVNWLSIYRRLRRRVALLLSFPCVTASDEIIAKLADLGGLDQRPGRVELL